MSRNKLNKSSLLKSFFYIPFLLSSIFCNAQNNVMLNSFLGYNKKAFLGVGYEHGLGLNRQIGFSIGFSGYSSEKAKYDSAKTYGLKRPITDDRGRNYQSFPGVIIQTELVKSRPNGVFFGAGLFFAFDNYRNKSVDRQFYFILNQNNKYIGTQNSIAKNISCNAISVGLGMPIGYKFEITDKLLLMAKTSPSIMYRNESTFYTDEISYDYENSAIFKESIKTNYILFSMAYFFNFSVLYEI